MIDCHKAFVIRDVMNFYTRVHAWMLTQNWIPNSAFFECTGGIVYGDQLYPDTYYMGFHIVNSANSTELHLNQLNVFYNPVIFDLNTVNNCGGMAYAFYYDNSGLSYRTYLNNSYLVGFDFGNYASLCNYDSNTHKIRLGNDVKFYKFLGNNRYNTRTLTSSDPANTTMLDNTLYFLNGMVDIEIRFQYNGALTSSAYQVTTIPQEYWPPAIIRTLIMYSSDQYTGDGYCELQIGTDGKVFIRALISNPLSATTNPTNRYFIGHVTYISSTQM
jgi:hypothetical protein